jgi:hypothetical protein
MTRDLLHLRRREIVPRLRGRAGTPGTSTRVGPSGLVVEWLLEDGETLTLLANLGSTPQPAPSRTGRGGRRLFGPPEPTGEDIWGAWFVAYDLAGGPP